MRRDAFVALGLFVIASFATAAFAARFEPGEWYASLVKPPWTPPDWLFAPVWALLYFALAVSAWLVWRQAGLRAAAVPLTVWTLQLILNGAWSWLFFGLHRPGLALLEIAVLWAAIVATVVLFWHRRPTAGALLLPYLAWVTFAAALNAVLWHLNT